MENILKTLDCLFTWIDNDIYVFDMNTNLIGFKYKSLEKLLSNNDLKLIGTSNKKLLQDNSDSVIFVNKNFINYEPYTATLEDGYVDELTYNDFFALGVNSGSLSVYPKGFCKIKISDKEDVDEYHHYESDEFTPEEWSGICKIFGLCEHTTTIRFKLSMLQIFNEENAINQKVI